MGIQGREEIQKLVLQFLDKEGKIADTRVWAENQKIEDHQELVAVLLSLELSNFVTLKSSQIKVLKISEAGKDIAKGHSVEFRLWEKLGDSVMKKEELIAEFGKDGNVAFSQAMGQKWIELVDGGSVRRKVQEVPHDVLVEQLRCLRDQGEVDKKVGSALMKRKYAELIKFKTFAVVKGDNFSVDGPRKLRTDVDAEVLADPSLWSNPGAFKPLNLRALGRPVEAGAVHPLLEVRAAFCDILVEMGFSEMPTDQYVESSFWNFDALFQPQQHPARDAHDTFFLTTPATAHEVPTAYLERVRRAHEEGLSEGPRGDHSLGWKYDWSLDEAKKNILRTHTTAVSARMLYRLAQQRPFRPAKLFSIDRVFRNETLDATHLAEFHQVEGLVAAKGLTLGDLIGTIRTFFAKLGIDNLRFKPAYNPYTEFSAEVFSYHEGLGKWVEIGNSGLFRPEMLRPMGFPEDVQVIAWGLSLERPTMIKYGIKNIRDLFGHKVALSYIQNAKICDIQMEPSEIFT